MPKSSTAFPASQEPHAFSSSDAANPTKSEERSPPYASEVLRFFQSIGISDPNVKKYSSKDFFFSNLIFAAIAERVAIATARTVVGEDKDIFLGELGMSYLSAAPKDAELIVDGSVVRSGRNITVVAIEFRMKKTGKLVYTSRATFYNSPLSKL
ncbi:hypothetical protein DITRI_Ditri13aG0033300 [Diplodiscus trichospermus]